MAVAEPIKLLSERDYLTLERSAEFKSEYFEGEVFAMAGGTRWHSLIGGNLVAELRDRLKGRPCVTYNAELRVKVEATGLQTYPDASVVCGPQRFLDAQEDTLLNPMLVAEVLSDSTEAYDRGRKFAHYRTIESLQEYVLVSRPTAVSSGFAVRTMGIGCTRNAPIPTDPSNLPRSRFHPIRPAVTDWTDS